jgi:hypothetical protein
LTAPVAVGDAALARGDRIDLHVDGLAAAHDGLQLGDRDRHVAAAALGVHGHLRRDQIEIAAARMLGSSQIGNISLRGSRPVFGGDPVGVGLEQPERISNLPDGVLKQLLLDLVRRHQAA